MTKAVPPVEATGTVDLDNIRRLFREFYDPLGDGPCFEDFEIERAGLPGGYAPPDRCILMAKDGNLVAGGFRTRSVVAATR